MMRTKWLALALLRNRRGATAIEYALIIAFLAIAMVASLQLMGSQLGALLHDVVTRYHDASN